MVSFLNTSRRQSKVAGKTDEIRDIWNDNAARIVGTVRAWGAGKARGLYDGCACDVEGGEGGRFDRAGGGSVFRLKKGRRSCRRAEGNGGITREGVAGRELSSGGVDG